MYCKNCGNEMDPNAAVCVKCGYQKGMGTNYCHNCGKETSPGASFCVNCGCSLQAQAQQPQQQAYPAGTQKSKLAAGLLGILLGVFGVHNFYLGYTGKAVGQLILGILCCTSPISAIWGLVEGVMILCGNINKDAKGIPLGD